MMVRGGDENFLIADVYDIGKGRSVSQAELNNGAYVCIVGSQWSLHSSKTMIPRWVKKFTVSGVKFKIIGVLHEQGGIGGRNGVDRRIVIPLRTARIFGADQDFGYETTVALNDTRNIDKASGIATGF